MAMAREGVRISREQSFPFWRGSGLVTLGWAKARLGEVEQGIAACREGLALCRATGARLQVPAWLGALADALRIGGEREAALEAVDEARALAEETGERYYLPQLARLREGIVHAGGECAASACMPVELASGETDLRSLAVNASHVFWTTDGGDIKKLPRDGGTPEVLTSGLDYPGALVADDDGLWFIEAGSDTLRHHLEEPPVRQVVSVYGIVNGAPHLFRAGNDYQLEPDGQTLLLLLCLVLLQRVEDVRHGGPSALQPRRGQLEALAEFDPG